MREWLTRSFSPPVVLTALQVSLVVGSALNLINNGSALVAGEGVGAGKLALNYVVPYLVATYSAVRAGDCGRQ